MFKKGKRILKVIGVVIFLAIWISQPGFAENMLENPGFELGSFLDWFKDGPNWDAQQDIVFNGDFAAQNSIMDVEDEDHYEVISQTFPFQPGQEIFATIQVKTDFSLFAQAKAGLQIIFWDQDWTQLGEEETKDVVSGSQDWQQLYLNAIAPEATVNITFIAYVWAPEGDNFSVGGHAYFDDGVLQTDFIQPPPPQDSLINGSFENGFSHWEVVEPGLDPDPGYPSTWQVQGVMVFDDSLAVQNVINMDLQNPSNNYFASLSQTISVQSGDPVFATAWVRANFNVTASRTAGLRIGFWDENNFEFTFIEDKLISGNANNEWFQLRILTSAPEQTVKITYTLFVWVDGQYPPFDGIVYFDAATLDFSYVRHLGVYGGQDTFPQEISQQPFYSGAASARATIRYLNVDSPSQSEIYNTYHWSGQGNDMLPSELVTALNEETSSTYNFSDWFQTTDKGEAIQNFVHWIDFKPPGGANSPAQVPVNGNLNWRTVRGFSTDKKPHPPGQPMPEFTVYGLWINDPAVSGLGFNIYQEISSFENDYLPVSGKYRSVYEPPENLNTRLFLEQMQASRVSLEPAKSNPVMKNLLSSFLAGGQLGIDQDSGLSQKDLSSSLPKTLMSDPSFVELLKGSQIVDVSSVYWKDQNKDYVIVALGPLEKERKEKSQLIDGDVNILMEFDPETGAFMQATWVPQVEIFPRIDKDQAITLAQDYLQREAIKKTQRNNLAKVAKSQGVSIRMVWSRHFKTSRFHPSYEISYSDGKIIYVHPDGRIQQQAGIGIVDVQEAVPAE